MSAGLEIVRVMVRRNEHGWFVAESEELPGLYLAAERRQEVLDDIPAAIELLFRAQGEAVKVMSVKPPASDRSGAFWWLPMPNAALAAPH